VGVDAIKDLKMLSGCRIDIIGLANDMTAGHTIGLSETIFLKMVCATFVMVPLELAAGDSVSVKALQSLASRAITQLAFMDVNASRRTPSPPISMSGIELVESDI
jgi:hypothetical protein